MKRALLAGGVVLLTVIAVAFVLVTIALYAGVATHAFVSLDVDQYLIENEVVRTGLSWEGVRWAFTSGYAAGEVLRIPVAHHDGQYFADDDTLAAMADNDQVAFRYVGGETPGPANPNGSLDDIAGIFNAAKTVLGLMPRP